MNPNVVLICRDCNTFSLSADKSHQKFLQPVKYCTNLENPPEPFCENVIWLCQNCYHSAVKSVNRDNNDCKSKSESRNQIETRYTNLIDLEKRIEALERHLKACPDLVQRATNAEANGSATQQKAVHASILNRRVLIPIAAIALSILIGLLLFTARSGNKESLQGIPDNATLESRPNSLLLISRDEWSAQTEPEGMQKLQLPIERIIIAHISTAQCENRVQCDARVRDVQAFHIHSNGWGDIGYNFLVGGDGLVYEGRGWYNQGAHTAGYNGNSICIGFIGTFNVEVLTENDLKAAQLLIDEGVRLGVLTGNYRLYGARQLSATESPGKALYSIIMKWPHWSRSI
ncbi:peptidoglycan-recognition protein LF isoform X1 [Bactrocera dorsalis]|uniref:Peptidoglycan-recognition protein LF isoform X1 n=1 Tax=Bactrocera dorsalis TaxID=27457 RepID=A0A6I9W260_BACDO|nr:peptidoglycan-recognition protein LF isoform X1 [Bactrocera dorsalis]